MSTSSAARKRDDHQGARMYEIIRYDVTDPVARITLNRPDRLNAVTGQMLQELQDSVGAADADERVVGIVLTGEGRGFCASADMAGLQDRTEGRSSSNWSVTGDKPGDIDDGV